MSMSLLPDPKGRYFWQPWKAESTFLESISRGVYPLESQPWYHTSLLSTKWAATSLRKREEPPREGEEKQKNSSEEPEIIIEINQNSHPPVMRSEWFRNVWFWFLASSLGRISGDQTIRNGQQKPHDPVPWHTHTKILLTYNNILPLILRPPCVFLRGSTL